MATKIKTASASTKAKGVAEAEAKNKTASAASGNSIPKSSLTSAVTTDLPNEAPSAPVFDRTWSEADELDMTSRDNSFDQRVIDYGLGQIQVEGIDFRYVGVAPARDKDAKAEGYDYPITPMNSRFTSLTEVAFHPSIRVKDAKTGKYYFPADGAANWGDVVSPDGNPLVPKEVHKASAAARREALKAARAR